jgi:hypothetical protein
MPMQERTNNTRLQHTQCCSNLAIYYGRPLGQFTPLVLWYTYLPVHEEQENTEAVYLERYTVNQFVNEDPKDSFSAL